MTAKQKANAAKPNPANHPWRQYQQGTFVCRRNHVYTQDRGFGCPQCRKELDEVYALTHNGESFDPKKGPK